MHVTYSADHEFSSAAAKHATGRSIEEWFAALDELGGPERGRKALGDYLNKEQKVDAWWTTTLLVEYEKARGIAEKDGSPRGYNICVTKSVAAAPPKVYEVLVDATWWLGLNAQAEFRAGGTFDDHEGHRGVIKKAEPGKTLRFTWEGPGHQAGETVDIKLSATGGKTSLVLNHDRLPDRAAADGMRAAWAKVLEELKEKVS